ncbi:DUF2213 domain-containing protein [Phytohalomonas tamaricis]|uniref:DUF2213 domain-containing protein n=1 Tax=Phytohalomonas tamaricis TaxID=2081032 RepID=UPI000D0BB3A4|nr:DUF2213 domain-containing protein [Phytohalomonas tamaricis]
MRTAHAHIVTRVNASQIKKETIEGEDHYRIPAVTLPDNVVMNGGLYPADEIEASYKSLENTPAPLGHPMVNGEFVSATHPIAVNKYGVGAWNTNVRRENGRVRLDKLVNIRVANQTEKGRQLIQAIEKQEPIHTSTGLTLQQRTGNGESKGKKYTWVAANMKFDHDCFLLGEPGAATPAEGVGVFVNSAGDKSDVLVSNVELTDDEEYEITAAAEHILRVADRAEDRERNKGRIDKLVTAIKSAFGGAQAEASVVNNANAPEGDMTKEELQQVVNEALKPFGEKLDALTTNQKEQGEAIGELKANVDEQKRTANAEVDAKLIKLGYSEDDLKAMTANAKQVTLKMAEKNDNPGQGFHLNAHFAGNADASKPQDTLPE